MGHEKTLTALIPALAGANLIYGPGMLESGITFDYAQLVIDSEFVRMIKHTLAGFEIDQQTLGVAVIKEVGPRKDFLSHEHTLRHMRNQSRPELIDRKDKEDWKAGGSLDIYAKARQKVRNILQSHQPEPLPQETAKQLRSIIEETAAELGAPS